MAKIARFNKSNYPRILLMELKMDDEKTGRVISGFLATMIAIPFAITGFCSLAGYGNGAFNPPVLPYFQEKVQIKNDILRRDSRLELEFSCYEQESLDSCLQPRNITAVYQWPLASESQPISWVKDRRDCLGEKCNIHLDETIQQKAFQFYLEEKRK